ncbi:family 43 glycosylhydrolase [Puia sp. P3]|uniref:family 43 glycosylhydrolase n=1 Tax=Puia sp. P3 TaxID=3423952 RepID=UPI003D67E811
MAWYKKFFVVAGCCCLGLVACSKSAGSSPGGGSDTSATPPPPAAFDINSITDTYENIASPNYVSQWGPYNVHDPSIRKFGDYYYCYSTDVAYGASVRPGIQIRKSKDLVQWSYVGWVFSGLPAQGSAFISARGEAE